MKLFTILAFLSAALFAQTPDCTGQACAIQVAAMPQFLAFTGIDGKPCVVSVPRSGIVSVAWDGSKTLVFWLPDDWCERSADFTGMTVSGACREGHQTIVSMGKEACSATPTVPVRLFFQVYLTT